MSDWREYRRFEARMEVETSKRLSTPPVVHCGRLKAYRMKNKGEYAIHVEPVNISNAERKFVKTTKKKRAFGFHGGLDDVRGFKHPELFFVLDGTDMGYKAAYENMLTGEVSVVNDAWRNIQIDDLTNFKFFTLGELYDYLCR